MKWLSNLYFDTYHFWILFNWVQAIVLFNLAPKLAALLLKFTKPCMVEDVDDNGVPYGFRILEADPAKDGWCPFLPRGWKVPKTMFFLIYSWNAASVQLFVNAWWMVVYRLEHPFFEQYKVEKDIQWPW